MKFKNLLTLKNFFIQISVFILFIQGVSFAQTNKSLDEIEQIKQETIKNLDTELNNSINDTNMRKTKELELIDASEISSKEKEKLRDKTEKQYREVIQKLEIQFSEKKRNTVDYYDSLLKEIKESSLSSEYKKKNEKQICILPNEIVKDLWKISTSYKYIGTIKFYSEEGVILAKVNFNMYNTWEETQNLTFDGYNIAFDYSNPYGASIHFKGCISKDGKLIKGEYIDKVKNKLYSWKAYR